MTVPLPGRLTIIGKARRPFAWSTIRLYLAVGGAAVDLAFPALKPASWYADGEIMRAAYVEHAEDDDWSQPGTLVREVMDEAARQRLVSNIVGALLAGVTEPVLQRAFSYLRNVDKNLGDKVEAGVRAGQR